MTMPPRSDLGTHVVTNKPEAAGDRDLWQDDPVLRQLAGGVGVSADQVAGYGALMGTRRMRDLARDANRHPPELQQFDLAGRRLDEVRFHPAYHAFMQASTAAGYHAVAWEPAPAGHATHACQVYLASQVEPGHCCPLTMTYASVPVLRRAGLEDWVARILSRDYDPSVRPMGQKAGLTIGMAMTEKQGGSDIRSNLTEARPDGEMWRLTGHKWFCSAPMSDGFLTLAQTGQGLGCFLVPRWLPEGRNAINIQRLKDKLGNRANASAEIEYAGARAIPIGAPGDGIRTIVEMVHHTRLDTALAPCGLMRAALREAHHWIAHRTSFQKRLIDQPLMRAVFADLALDWIGALTLGLHVAGRFDGSTPEDRAYARLAVAIAKYHANKLCPLVTCEAMEMLGGMGYVEDTMMPMLYREAPLNGIWEGSGNVICLDALRSLKREPLAAEVLAEELDAARCFSSDYDANLNQYRDRWSNEIPEAEARWFVENTALLLSASALLRQGHPVAEVFARTRLTGARGRFSGALADAAADQVIGASFAG